MENASMKSLAPHFESILDTLSDGVFISDVEGTTLFVNKMYETLTGLRQGEIRGKNIRTLVQQGTFDKVVNPQIVETGKPATHVQQLANGKRLVLTGHPVFDDKGQLCLVVTFARDITVLTQLQEEMTAQKKLIEQFHDRQIPAILERGVRNGRKPSASDSLKPRTFKGAFAYRFHIRKIYFFQRFAIVERLAVNFLNIA